jgi:glycosyltransferase involved in cell wall biosynthesis
VSVCLVVDDPKIALGGAERQGYFLAQALSKEGFEVHLVGRSDAQPGEAKANGVTTHSLRQVRGGEPIRTVRYVQGLLELRRILKELHADLYYQRTALVETGIVASASQALGKAFIFGSSSIWNPTNNLHGRLYLSSPLDYTGLPSFVYHKGVAKASAIVAQTSQIAELFRKALPGVDVRHIPPANLSPLHEAPMVRDGYAVSITRLVWYRRPQYVLKLARMLPDIKFVLAGHGPMESEIKRECSGITNVEFLGRVSPEAALGLISKANLFVNTSLIEGFPNTLLESLSCGTPYVSFYDPDEILCRFSLGFHVRSISEAANSIRESVRGGTEMRKFVLRAREYLTRYHDATSITASYVRLFKEKVTR